MLGGPTTYATHPRIFVKRRNLVQPVSRTSSTVRESQEDEHKRLHRALRESDPVTILLPIMAVVLRHRDRRAAARCGLAWKRTAVKPTSVYATAAALAFAVASTVAWQAKAGFTAARLGGGAGHAGASVG